MKFLIPEFSNEILELNIPKHLQYDVYDIFEEAAKIFYWGKGGWNYPWPLYFECYGETGNFISKADIFILSADYELIFDIIIKKGIGQ